MPVIAGRTSDVSLLGGAAGHGKLEFVLTMLAFILPFTRYIRQIGTKRFPGGQLPDLRVTALRAFQLFLWWLGTIC